MRSHNCHLNLFDVGRSYSNLQLPSLQQPKIASHIFLHLFILPLVLFSTYANFLHIFPSPPASHKLYSITILYSHALYCLYYLIHSTYINCDVGRRKLAAFLYFSFKTAILITSQAKAGRPQYLHFNREFCKYYYNCTRTFPISSTTVTHFLPLNHPLPAACPRTSS